MISPFSVVKNTRESYSIFHRETDTEGEVQFEDEKPTWIPLETLLAIQKYLSNK